MRSEKLGRTPGVVAVAGRGEAGSHLLASRKRTSAWRVCARLALGGLAGCSAAHHEHLADRTALGILEARDAAVLGCGEATAKVPQLKPPPAETPPAAPGEEQPPAPEASAHEPQVLDLREALALAYETNHDMIDRRDVLHVQALALA